jgi:hypothetical protein
MQKNEFKIGLVLLALLVVLGALTGGQKLYNAKLLEKPVLEELQTLRYVASARINKTDNVYQVQVNISQPGNIKNEYNEINKVVADHFKRHQYEIQLIDKRDENLQNDLQSMELAIYEAIARDNYLALEQRLADQAERAHFEYLLQIDQQKLYVGIFRNDRFLYEIFERVDTGNSSQ